MVYALAPETATSAPSLVAPGGDRYVPRLGMTAGDVDGEERALRESEERFRTICEHAPVMIDCFDETGRCVLWNRECERRLGYTQEEISAAGDPLSLFYPEAATRDRVLDAIQRADGQYREYRVRAKDGSERIQLWADFRLPTGASISVGHDITERRGVEEQLRHTQKMEALGTLTGGIAHDFNNLLTVILANATLLDRRLSEEQGRHQDVVGEIVKAASDAADLVRKLLAFSRKEALQARPLDLGELVQGEVVTLRRLLPESIEVRQIVSPDVPLIDADPGAVQQILFNLATNARDAMPGGGLLLVRVQPGQLDGEPGVELIVEDEGDGMDEVTCRRCVEPFFTTKPRGAGTGLGLAMVCGLSNQHDGQVEVESEMGRGTRVRVLFPVGRATFESEPARAVPEVVASEFRGTILFVEDQPQIRRSARNALEDRGYRVMLAEHGEQALELAREHGSELDLVISDSVMPKLGGVALLERLRDEGIDVPFVLTTGYRDAAEEFGRAGLADLPTLLKPWTVQDLLRAVGRALGKRDPIS